MLQVQLLRVQEGFRMLSLFSFVPCSLGLPWVCDNGAEKVAILSYGIRAGEKGKKKNAGKSNLKFVDVQAGFWVTHKLFIL